LILLLNLVNYVGNTSAQSDCPKNIFRGTGSSTIEKRNRKKRATRNLSPDVVILKRKVHPDVDAFYTKFVRNKYYASSKRCVCTSMI
jgi:hypothetical protein